MVISLLIWQLQSKSKYVHTYQYMFIDLRAHIESVIHNWLLFTMIQYIKLYTIFRNKIWKRLYCEITYWNCVCDINPHKEAYDLSPRAKNRSYSMFSHFAAGEKSTKIKRICVSCYNLMGETAAGHMTHVCIMTKSGQGWFNNISFLFNICNLTFVLLFHHDL